MLFLDFLNDDYFFNRPVKDMTPYKIVRNEDKTILILNTLGISPDDIEVEVTPGDSLYTSQYLHVSGKTKDELSDKEYNINMKFTMKKPVKKIEWESRNGLTYLSLIFVEPEKPSVSIVRK